MDNNNTIRITKRLKIALIFVLLLILVPLIAMQFTEEVKWSVFDFLVATMLLLAVVFSIEFILLSKQKSSTKLLYIIAILTLSALIWLELAVGIFNSPVAGS